MRWIEDSLIRKCKEQEVVFDTFSLHVLRLKLPIPTGPGSESVGGQRFITRMRDTDFFQALSMYLFPPSVIQVITIGLILLSHSPRKRKKKPKRHILQKLSPSYRMNMSRVCGSRVISHHNLPKSIMLQNIFVH
jgi:hypothetical protein